MYNSSISLQRISHSGSCLHLSCCMHATPPTYAYSHMFVLGKQYFCSSRISTANMLAQAPVRLQVPRTAHTACITQDAVCEHCHTPRSLPGPNSLAALSHVKTRYTTRHALCGPKLCCTAASPVDQAAHDMANLQNMLSSMPIQAKIVLCCCLALKHSTICSATHTLLDCPVRHTRHPAARLH